MLLASMRRPVLVNGVFGPMTIKRIADQREAHKKVFSP
jgi:hypothetical protein